MSSVSLATKDRDDTFDLRRRNLLIVHSSHPCGGLLKRTVTVAPQHSRVSRKTVKSPS